MYASGAQSRINGGPACAIAQTPPPAIAEEAIRHARRLVDSGGSQHATMRYTKYAQAIHSNERTDERYLIVYHYRRTRAGGPPFRMTASIDVRPVQGRREIRRFVDYMYERNASDPHWVPPLRLGEHDRINRKKNPFFAHAEMELLLAWRGDRVVGRIAAIGR